MAKLQLVRAKAVGVDFINSINNCYDVIVDADFRSGLKRPLEAKIGELI